MRKFVSVFLILLLLLLNISCFASAIDQDFTGRWQVKQEGLIASISILDGTDSWPAEIRIADNRGARVVYCTLRYNAKEDMFVYKDGEIHSVDISQAGDPIVGDIIDKNTKGSFCFVGRYGGEVDLCWNEAKYPDVYVSFQKSDDYEVITDSEDVSLLDTFVDKYNSLSFDYDGSLFDIDTIYYDENDCYNVILSGTNNSVWGKYSIVLMSTRFTDDMRFEDIFNIPVMQEMLGITIDCDEWNGYEGVYSYTLDEDTYREYCFIVPIFDVYGDVVRAVNITIDCEHIDNDVEDMFRLDAISQVLVSLNVGDGGIG